MPETVTPGNGYTSDEMMTVAAARMLSNRTVCFVGIGLPSAAANLARLTHAPDIVLIYESGPIGTKPAVLPLSIGDGELAETADTVVPLVEIFSYWLTGRPHRHWISGRRANRSLRESQYHGDRRLPQALGATAGRGRRAGDRDFGQGGLDHAATEQTGVRREGGFRNIRAAIWMAGMRAGEWGFLEKGRQR